jgi:hypothetical protein
MMMYDDADDSGGTFQDATRLYLIVELGAGGDLFSHIQRQPNKVTSLMPSTP